MPCREAALRNEGSIPSSRVEDPGCSRFRHPGFWCAYPAVCWSAVVATNTKRQLLGGVRTRKEDALFHDAR